jgi:hypothetical protein
MDQYSNPSKNYAAKLVQAIRMLLITPPINYHSNKCPAVTKAKANTCDPKP